MFWIFFVIFWFYSDFFLYFGIFSLHKIFPKLSKILKYYSETLDFSLTQNIHLRLRSWRRTIPPGYWWLARTLHYIAWQLNWLPRPLRPAIAHCQPHYLHGSVSLWSNWAVLDAPRQGGRRPHCQGWLCSRDLVEDPLAWNNVHCLHRRMRLKKGRKDILGYFKWALFNTRISLLKLLCSA